MNERTLNNETQLAPPPAWPELLLEALQLADDWQVFQQEPLESVSKQFLQRCDQTARVAWYIARLRRAVEQIGFLPWGLMVYLAKLAATTEVQLSAVLERFGLDDLTAPNPASAPGLVRLAQALGLGQRALRAHLLIGLLPHLGLSPEPLNARFRADNPLSAPLDECEAALARIEQNAEPAAVAEMRRFTTALNAAWQSSKTD
ncbi:MAG: hypothetical protein HY011_25160 [Acidobacteria bacterium]|nr:hypothetical protein [Acidobacteriota bacterium]